MNGNESVMAQARKTWLKQECLAIGINLFGTAATLQELGINAVTSNKSTHDFANNMKVYINHDKYKPSQVDIDKVNWSLDEIQRHLDSGNQSMAVKELFNTVQFYKAIALEHTVECQCGKQNALAIGTRVKIRSGFPQAGETGTITGGKPNGWGIKFDGSDTISYTYLDNELIIIG